MTVRGTLVEDNHEASMVVLGADCAIEGSVFRNTLPTAEGSRGLAIALQSWLGERTIATIRSSVLERSKEQGLTIVDSEATVEGTVVRDVSGGDSEWVFGDGIDVVSERIPPSRLVLRDSEVSRSVRAGVANVGGDVSLERARFECNTLHLDGELLLGPPFEVPYLFHDLGGNSCGCEGQRMECVVLTTGLQPPPPIE